MTESARALLTDPTCQVPHPAPASHGMAWLRSSVARFCDGPDHERRRAVAVAQLAQVDPAALRTGRGTVTEILADAVGLPRSVAPDVAVAAQAYHPHVTATMDADVAVERLIAAGGGHHDEATAARIGLLVQAHAATTALVAGVNPPVPATRRISPSGNTSLIDLAGLPFGAGAHACPGRAHALALAASQLPFHQLHHRDTPLVLPNAWDCASAAALVQAGFPAIGTTSLGVAAAHGLPDAAGATLHETLALAANLVRLPVPVTIDIEAGLGADPVELAPQLAELGVAGVNIEDGRGDHLADPTAQAQMLARFKDAAPAMFVNARIDTYWLGRELPSTVARVQRYTDAGADGVFVPGLTDDHDISDIVACTRLPLNVLAQPDLPRLTNLGVRRISTGSQLFRTALTAALDAANAAANAASQTQPTTATPLTYQRIDELAQHYALPATTD